MYLSKDELVMYAEVKNQAEIGSREYTFHLALLKSRNETNAIRIMVASIRL